MNNQIAVFAAGNLDLAGRQSESLGNTNRLTVAVHENATGQGRHCNGSDSF
jgi:hypothetical protein